MGYETIQEDIKFIDETNKLILDPLKIESEFSSDGETRFTITNGGESSFTNLGVYIQPTTNLGPWDNPAENPPQTDYQELLTWGTKAWATSVDADQDFKKGGLKLYINPGSDEYEYITRTNGSMFSNRIKIPSIGPGLSHTLKLVFEVPASVDAQRLYISMVVG